MSDFDKFDSNKHPWIRTPLTSTTTLAIAQLLIKNALYDHYLDLVRAIAEKGPSQLSSLSPSGMRKVMAAFVKEQKWEHFALMASFIKDTPSLLATVTPKMIQEFLRTGYNNTTFARLTHAISSRPDLIEHLTVKQVSAASQEFVERIPSAYQVYSYSDKTEPFSWLAIGVKDNPTLNPGINPEHVATIAMAIFKDAEREVKEYQTDQCYPSPLPDHFKGFSQFISFAAEMIFAPDSWGQAFSKQIPIILEKADNRSLVFIAEVIKSNPSLLDTTAFKLLLDNLPDKMGDILYAFKDVDHLAPAYQEAIAALIKNEFQSWGYLSLGIDFLGEKYKDIFIRICKDMLTTMAAQANYGNLSKLAFGLGYRNGGLGEERVNSILESFGLACASLNCRKLHQPEGLPVINFLTFVFFQASEDALICFETPCDNNDQSSLQSPYAVSQPIQNDVDLKSDQSGRSGFFREAFSLVANRKEGGEATLPIWCNSIIKQILEPSASEPR